MTTYAVNTIVAPEKTRAEIERVVTRYGATKFVSGWEESGAAVLFEMRGRRVRFSLPLPDKSDERFLTGHGRRQRTFAERQKAYDQHVRSAWRALYLVIKAKLEAVESGIGVFESEFLANIVLPGTGETFGEWAIPKIAAAYNGTPMPPMLPGAKLLPGANTTKGDR